MLFEATAAVLSEYEVAAELNFHGSHRPAVKFVMACLNRDVKFTFGSDSHNLAEIGDFACQLALLEDAGFDGDVRNVLL